MHAVPRDAHSCGTGWRRGLAERFTVVATDLRGFGASGTPAEHARPRPVQHARDRP
ncbi:hypothetical protein [Nonomuraea dietziae]|uniref:hypothetical protein n=1 Tax=Nonomuraea dietziae TaxID=65515 RepID=UPI003CD08282